MVRNFMQQDCKRCGNRYRISIRCAHGNCPVTPAMMAALQKYAREHGRTWKSKLLIEWERACSKISNPDDRSLLQQVRNIVGPGRLHKIKL